jgi:sugar phosphate isomerase/epimerase
MGHRRHFLGSCAAASVACIAKSSRGQTKTTEGKHPVAVFAKPLQHLDFNELGRRLNSIGVQGIEATLRSGGQVEPENFDRDLNKLVGALAKHDQRVLIAASDINDVSPASEQQLRMFAQAGIPYFRMQYYRYDFSQPILPQLDKFAQQAAELAALCKSLGITALYQNHAGKNYVGAALWDLQRVLHAIDPSSLAVAFDVRHAALELSQSWPAGYAVIRPHIGAIYVKDFAWIDGQATNVPLGAGIAGPVFAQVKKDGLIGPLSLHVEYFDHRDKDLQEQRWAAVQNDVTTLRQWLS